MDGARGFYGEDGKNWPGTGSQNGMNQAKMELTMLARRIF